MCVVTGKIMSHVSDIAHALYKARNPVIDGFFITITSLNDVLKLVIQLNIDLQ